MKRWVPRRDQPMCKRYYVSADVKTFRKGARKLVKTSIYRQIDLPIKHNAKYSQTELLSALTYTACRNDFLESSTNILSLDSDNVPSADTIFYHLKKLTVPEVRTMFRSSFEMVFKEGCKRGLFRRRMGVCLAIDVTDIPYYGKTRDPHILGTKHVRGTNYAFKMATVSVVDKGERFTLCTVPLNAFSEKTEFVKELLDFAREKVKIDCLLLDREFFAIDAINLLLAERVNFIMPAIRNEKIQRTIDWNRGKFPLVMEYELGKGERTARFNLAIFQDKEEPYVFATNLKSHYKLILGIPGIYRKRWGIETGYRVKKDFRARTCAMSYVVRLFYFLLSVCLYNIWVLCNVFVGMDICRRLPLEPLITTRLMRYILERDIITSLAA